ncbi:DUF2000 family protein [Pseudonocardia sp. CA-107938]|uniref:DUF2000 family protein n=1 Tax=Pseudonocardia sp. CA-107938 TaxID=3240021 RepID=UPI003D9498B3
MSRTVYASYPGFDTDEIRTDQPAEHARLAWVIVVDETLPPASAATAAALVAAATSPRVAGLLGPDATDAGGSVHPGLPWGGCSVRAASGASLVAMRDVAVATEEVLVVDVPAAVSRARVYDEYLAEVRRGELRYLAVGVVGPRGVVEGLLGGASPVSAVVSGAAFGG